MDLAANPHAPPPARVAELDGLRGIAALSVVAYHFMWGYPTEFPHLPHLPIMAYWGRYGVHLFFAISGFVIFMTLNNTTQARNFLVARFSRLYPAYWACMAITLPVVSLWGPQTFQLPLRDILLNITMLHEFADARNLDPSYWTLPVELLFYFYMLILWRLGALKHIELILTVWVAAKLLWWACDGPAEGMNNSFILNQISFFVIGILAYRVWNGDRHWREQLTCWGFTAFAVALADPVHGIILFMILTGMFAALAKGQLRWLCHPVLLWLGAISYPLYLVHQNVGMTLMIQLSHLGVPPAISLACAFAVAIGLATLVSRCVERPALAAIRQWWRGQRRTVVV